MPNRLKLLVADDCPDDKFLFQRAVKKTGVQLNPRFVEDGQEAVDYLEGAREFSDREAYPMPALIILDVKMPGMNGFDVLRWLKSHSKHCKTPVLICSSSDD